MQELCVRQVAVFSTGRAVLSAVGLGCGRNGRRLFKDVSFGLGAGDMLRITGPNGSGKSSLLRLLCGLAQPDEGYIELFGQALVRHSGALASRLLWIGHAPGVKALLTVQENLSWLAALHGHGTIDAIEGAIVALGLRGFEDTRCHALSAGQQRRVALARLYLPGAPMLWLLDEPFTALDKAGTAQLEAHLAMHCERGGTVVLTTHHELARPVQAYAVLNLGQYAT